MRVFPDTHLIAGVTATRGPCADALRTAIEFHDLVVSEHLIAELRRVGPVEILTRRHFWDKERGQPGGGWVR